MDSGQQQQRGRNTIQPYSREWELRVGVSCGVVFVHEERDMSLVVHGDDFTFCGLEEDLMWIKGSMETWFEIQVRALMGMDAKDDKEVTILGKSGGQEKGLSMRRVRSTGG